MPLLDEDYLILSTIHSAKGQEWTSVYLMHAVDGCLRSDLATGTTKEIEEERRLLYVAMTRAKNHLHLIVPQRFFAHSQRGNGRPSLVRIAHALHSCRDPQFLREPRLAGRHCDHDTGKGLTRADRHRCPPAPDVEWKSLGQSRDRYSPIALPVHNRSDPLRRLTRD